MIYVVVEQEGAYSDKEWRVLGVFSESKKAIIHGLKMMMETAQKPWKLEFYKKRKAQYANAVALPEIHIEAWDLNGAKVENIYLGFQEKPFKHFIDAILKNEEVEKRSCEALLKEWTEVLQSDQIPSKLESLISYETLK